ncbi:MAG: hypothetical protein WBG38_20600, partial [Nodosilinea sp.]
MNYRSAINRPALGLAAVAAVLVPGLVAAADTLPPGLIELTDGNSVYQADLLRFSADQSWLVEGVETLFTDLYFLNIGNSPASRELRLEDFQSVAFSQPASNRLSATFSNFGANLNLSINSILLGGEPG